MSFYREDFVPDPDYHGKVVRPDRYVTKTVQIIQHVGHHPAKHINMCSINISFELGCEQSIQDDN